MGGVPSVPHSHFISGTEAAWHSRPDTSDKFFATYLKDIYQPIFNLDSRLAENPAHFHLIETKMLH